jgi:hypothetical protein
MRDQEILNLELHHLLQNHYMLNGTKQLVNAGTCLNTGHNHEVTFSFPVSPAICSFLAPVLFLPIRELHHGMKEKNSWCEGW